MVSSRVAERVAAYVIREGVIDAEGRERLARYVSRPPFAERQARLCRDGRVAFRLGHPKPTGKTHLFLDPLTFLRRVTSQIPPLGMNLV
ncbi:MAG: transposase [Polyangiaceae bacterium]|nr:transposase [Polyangiaceae bacterium]